MIITITAISILAISALVWLTNRVLPFTVCPICTGVFLTWLWLVVAHFLGYQIDLVIPALLMGGSVVGIAYQLEKKSRSSSAGALLLLKVSFIIAGFVVAYALLQRLWPAFLLAAVFLAITLFTFLLSNGKSDSRKETVGEIEKKMEDCC